MPTLLVYEDNATLAELFPFMLAEEGYDVLTALTLPEALAILSNHPVDLILADLEHGPYTDASWSGLCQLRRAALNMPIIVCTGHSQAATVPLEQAGVQAILLKPFGLDELLELVSQFC